MACKMALKATKTVVIEEKGKKEIDIKNYAKVEKVSYFLFLWAYNLFKNLLYLIQIIV